MTLAPLSTAQWIAAAREAIALAAGCVTSIEADSRDACGAVPMTPLSAAVPRPASTDATLVPCSFPDVLYTGVWPSADPSPEKSLPATTAPRRSGIEPSTPLSITATLTPAPRVTVQAFCTPSAERYHCADRTASASAGAPSAPAERTSTL